jgi:hypothetical protein
MKSFGILILAIIFSTSSRAEEVFKIEIGKDYKSFSHSEMQRRVWELERAVWQLQQKVFQLENKPSAPSSDSWICTAKAMGNSYTGTGGSKAVAKSKAIEACKAARGGDGFFCKEVECEQ